MIIYLNGKLLNVPEEHSTLAALLEWQNVPTKATAVAVNNKIVRRNDWPFHRLQSEDQVTVINAAFGG